MRRQRALLGRSFVILALSACASASTSAASAQGAAPPGAPVPGKEHAKRLFDEGIDLEKKGDHASALEKYKEAEQIAVTPGLRFHKGYCLEMMLKLAAALDEYEAADKMAREQNKQDVHAAITTRLDPLRARVPQIAIRLATPASGADVRLDGAAIAPVLLDGKAFRIDPGEHTVTARAAGYKDLTRKVHAPESVTTTVDVSLDRIGSPVGAAEAGPPPDVLPGAGRGHGRSRVLPIATTAGAVALVGVGLAFFLAAGSAQSDAETSCATKRSCDDERSGVRTLDTLALGSFVGAAGLGVLSLVLWTAKGGRDAAHGKPETATRAHPIAAPGTFAMTGTF
jgi:hypothetical protein